MPSWTLVLTILEWLIRVGMVPVVVLRKRKPSVCTAWLLLVFFLPWVGLILYVLIGENRLGRRRAVKRLRRLGEYEQAREPHPEPPDGASALGQDTASGDAEGGGDAETPATAILGRLAQAVGGFRPARGNEVAFLSDTDETIDRLVADIAEARHHVHLLFYIIRSDAVGDRVGDALVDAVGRGVECRLLADSVGSWWFFGSLGRRLRHAGVEVAEALPANPIRRRFERLDLRNHRKLAVIDGRVAYTGSQNIVEATYGHRRAGPWHDVMARVTGPLVRQLQVVFLEDWSHETGHLVVGEAYFPRAEPTGRSTVQPVPTGPGGSAEQFKDLLIEAVHLARRKVVLTSPYFVPDETMMLALRLAVHRGVQLTIVVPRRTDMRLVDSAGTFYCEYLAREGADVYLHDDGMLHTKALTVDDTVALFGSANFDVRSFQLDFELTLLLYGAEAVSALRKIQRQYQGRSTRADVAYWENRGWLPRLASNVTKLASPLL